ncbi:hypothetical protein HJB51_29150 [Rhizobium lentis]|uniref:hypothetical protein n=1 Tax=Rhizobium lentis TaxID=1138194 RepID=UPI001C82BED3|nr:hypothetical protein [Rhizobium lentis]MBX5112001.1 hypothetical protein [Rhizobium lentis]
MSEITVAYGWQHIFAEALEEAAALPEEWCFEISKAETVGGAMKLSATYVSGDVPLDDHLPPERKLPHPWRSMMRIREKARTRSLQTCECCGRMGKLIGAGETARVRCARHEYVVDVDAWAKEMSTERSAMFENEEDAVAHFLQDYGDGIDMMKDLQSAAEDPDERDPKTRH